MQAVGHLQVEQSQQIAARLLEALSCLGVLALEERADGRRRRFGLFAPLGLAQLVIFDVSTLVSYIGNYMTLLPGDLISIGTPAGVGLGFGPPQYLRPGDVVELGIDGLGTQKQTAVPRQIPIVAEMENSRINRPAH